MIFKLITLAVLTVFAFDTFNSNAEFTEKEKYIDVSFDTESMVNTYVPFLQLSTRTEPYCLASYKTEPGTFEFKCDS